MKKLLLVPLVLCLLVLSLSHGFGGQSKQIRGIVINPDGTPASRVEVRVVSRAAVTRAVTGANGRFSIELPPAVRRYG